jgi:hypothetical protein
MTTAALVFVVLALLTFGIMLVTAAGARPSHRLDSAHRQAEEKGNALLRSWLTPEQDKQWLRDHALELSRCLLNLARQASKNKTYAAKLLRATA